MGNLRPEVTLFRVPRQYQLGELYAVGEGESEDGGEDSLEDSSGVSTASEEIHDASGDEDREFQEENVVPPVVEIESETPEYSCVDCYANNKDCCRTSLLGVQRCSLRNDNLSARVHVLEKDDGERHSFVDTMSTVAIGTISQFAHHSLRSNIVYSF